MGLKAGEFLIKVRMAEDSFWKVVAEEVFEMKHFTKIQCKRQTLLINKPT
jgi:hypothetical protein